MNRLLALQLLQKAFLTSKLSYLVSCLAANSRCLICAAAIAGMIVIAANTNARNRTEFSHRPLQSRQTARISKSFEAEKCPYERWNSAARLAQLSLTPMTKHSLVNSGEASGSRKR